MTSLGLMQRSIDSHDALFEEMRAQESMSRRQLFATAAAIPVIAAAAKGDSTPYRSRTGGASATVKYEARRGNASA